MSDADAQEQTPHESDERRCLLFSNVDLLHSHQSLNVGAKSSAYCGDVASDISVTSKLPKVGTEMEYIRKLENALNVMPAGHRSLLCKEALTKMRLHMQEHEVNKDSTFSFDGQKLTDENPFRKDKKMEEKTADTSESLNTKDSAMFFDAQRTKTLAASSENQIAIISKHGETIRVEEGIGNEATLCDLISCNVTISVQTNAVQIISVQNSLLIFAPVLTSVVVRNCQDMTLVVAAQQVRICDCHHVKLFVAARGALIIEDSDSIVVAPYGVKGVHLDFDNDHWRNLKDFNWLAESGQSPNWSILDKSEWKVFDL